MCGDERKRLPEYLTDVVKYNLFLQNEYLIAENLWLP